MAVPVFTQVAGSGRPVLPGEKGSGLGVNPGLARKHSVILLQGTEAEG